MQPFKHYPSTIIALIIWGATGFMAQPTIASLFVHILLVPCFLALLVWIAHWEGHKQANK